MRETSPVAVPLFGVTAMLTFSTEPCVIFVVGINVSAVVVETVFTVPQFVARLAIFREPSPVAKS
jgi:hypothetical protein